MDMDLLVNGIEPEKLTCNYLEEPLGVDTDYPQLSWRLKSRERMQYQTAYRIIVSKSREVLDKDAGDLWDSGKVKSDQSVLVRYNGIQLMSRQKCWWKVCVWDRDGKQSRWSEPSFWEMGLLRKNDWKAKWIAYERRSMGMPGVIDYSPAPLFRKDFTINREILSARAYVCGLGFYEFYINGKKAGSNVLSPGFSAYDRTVLYETYDITEALHKGSNVFGAVLGNGWYNCFFDVAWYFRYAPWRDHPKLLIQVHIRFDNGEEEVLVTDTTWQTDEGPIVYDSIMNGETYDARREIKDWNKEGFDDSHWRNAQIAKPPGGILKSMQMQPVRVIENIKPVSLKKIKKGVWVYDIGRNISGWVRIKTKGNKGDTVVLKYAEKLKEDGDIDVAGLDIGINSGEFQTDKYVFKGDGVECWEPRFTYHGFQYVQVSGFKGGLSLDSLEGCRVHIAFTERGGFCCSNELLNKIQDCTKNADLSNFFSYPTDCPHREKNGWTGDAQLSAEQMLLNFNPMTAYEKWMNDFTDAQRPNGQLPAIIPTCGWGYNWGSGPAWDSAVILIPWYLYVYCGDKAILQKMYDSMKLYMEFLRDMSENNIVDFGLGDWSSPQGNKPDGKCPRVFTDTAYYFNDALIISKIAGILGNGHDKEYYAKLADDIKKSFRNKFLSQKTGRTKYDCQTSISCVLYQELAEEGEWPFFIKTLEKEVAKMDYHIDCGILGAKYIMHALTKGGRADLAYKMAVQTTYPGWGYWMEQGATTLWETWSGNMSHNHHMFGDISAWFYKALAGINPDEDEPGFRHIIIKPNPVGDLKWVKAWHDSMYGKIKLEWSKNGETFRVKADIPANCTADIYLPCSNPASVMENGEKIVDKTGISLQRYEKGTVVLKVSSGTYEFTCTQEP
jgi:alpha-L-rhamnosidase